MRDDCYQAKLWLNRNYYSSRQLDADKRTLSILENKLGSGVAKYENDGTGGDSDAARLRHEDALLDYSEMRKKIEREEKELSLETQKTRRAIDKLEGDDCKAVAIDRYINYLKWNDISDLEHISRAQLFRVHGKMLEQMAEILKKEVVA